MKSLTTEGAVPRFVVRLEVVVNARRFVPLVVYLVLLLIPASHLRSQTSLEDLVEQATPAVVLIETVSETERRFGSGFIVDPSGLVLTNLHVIENAEAARVKLASGDIYDNVAVLAEDVRRDIALLHIRGFGLPTLELGDSDSVRVGAYVVAIGSPLGLENTVSDGIVSGERQLEGYRLYQITAPISPGSSGGPIMDEKGRVIGIATAQISEGQNLNFAVPINYARGMIANLPSSPLYVIAPTEDSPTASGISEVASRSVNDGLVLDFSAFREIEMEHEEKHEGIEAVRTTAYRMAGLPDDPDARIERFHEFRNKKNEAQTGSERSIAAIDGLRPIEESLAYQYYDGNRWIRGEGKVKYEAGRVVGWRETPEDGRSELRRDLPEGILSCSMTALAFAYNVAANPTVEITCYNFWADELTAVRYTVKGRKQIKVLGQKYQALEVEVVAGLQRMTLYYEPTVPRYLLDADIKDFKVKRRK